MTTFEQRERAFEAKYAHDEEFRFRITARRDKLFAHWVAEQLHLLDQDSVDLTSRALAVKDGPGHDERLLDLARQTYLVHGAKDPAGLLPALHQCAEKARLELLDHHPLPLNG